MAKHKSLLDEKPFKDWNEAASEFAKLAGFFIENESRFDVGHRMARFQFRLELTAEQQRRKKRR